MNGLTLEKASILPILFDLGIDVGAVGPDIGGNLYEIPLASWVYGAFARAWIEFYPAYMGEGYTPGSTVCRHFATECMSFCGRQFRANPEHAANAAAFFGTFKYMPTGSPDGHDINWFLQAAPLSAAYPWEIHFFEPQCSALIPPQKTLSQSEITSCAYMDLP